MLDAERNSEEFDLAELEKLVSEALDDRVANTAPVPSEAKIPFGLGEARLLEKLSHLLPKYMAIPDQQMVLNELRDELKDGIDLGNLREVHGVVKNCRKCPSVRPTPHLPTWNVADPDVVFVSDLPYTGSKNDEYLVDCLKAAGFSSRRICLTSATRCFPSESRAPNESEIDTCTKRFLFTEIQLLNPKLVVTLGGPASAVFLGNIKITEDRGRIFWLGPWPILPTYSAAYVLRGKGAAELRTDFEKAHGFVYG